MRRHARQFLERYASGVFEAIRAIRNRQYFKRQFSPLHIEVREKLFSDAQPMVIQSGPFQGMRYFDEPVWGSITPKWLGSYEAELHGVMEEVHAKPYDTIVDIGCAEGYYAVGLALLHKRARIFAFDMDFISRGQTRRLGRLNRVEHRMKIASRCRHQDLKMLSSGRTLVVCDIEGGEEDLLNPSLAPSLLQSDILVEVHEQQRTPSAVEAKLRSRFEATHLIRRVSSENRLHWIEKHGGEMARLLGKPLILRATDERRSNGNVWLWMRSL